MGLRRECVQRAAKFAFFFGGNPRKSEAALSGGDRVKLKKEEVHQTKTEDQRKRRKVKLLLNKPKRPHKPKELKPKKMLQKDKAEEESQDKVNNNDLIS